MVQQEQQWVGVRQMKLFASAGVTGGSFARVFGGTEVWLVFALLSVCHTAPRAGSGMLVLFAHIETRCP